jgi:hypothetical protein
MRMRNDLAVLLVAAALSYPLGLWIGRAWLLPLLNALPAYLVLVHRLRKGERGGAVRAMLWWAATLAIVGTVTLVWWSGPIAPVVFHGPEYRQEMFHWIRTGQGAEGSPRLFIPQHLLHLAIFVGLGLATASVGAIIMGAIMMNYMSYYVASLARAGTPAWAVTLLGWQPYAIARVAAFATLGVILAEPLVFRLFPAARLKARPWGRAPYIVAAMTGILTDWFLKTLLAPLWGEWLRRLLP